MEVVCETVPRWVSHTNNAEPHDGQVFTAEAVPAPHPAEPPRFLTIRAAQGGDENSIAFATFDYEDEFAIVRKAVEDAHREAPASKAGAGGASKMRSFRESKKFNNSLQSSKDKVAPSPSESASATPAKATGAAGESGAGGEKEEPLDLEARIAAKQKAMRERMAKGGGGMKKFSPKKRKGSSSNDASAGPAVLDFSDGQRVAPEDTFTEEQV